MLEAAFYRVGQPLIASENQVVYLNFIPGSVDPLGVVCHPIDVGKSLYPHLDFSRIVEDTAGAIHVVLDRRKTIIVGSVPKNRLVPK